MRSNPSNMMGLRGENRREYPRRRAARLKYLIYRQDVESDSDLRFGEWGLRIDNRLVSLTMHI